MTSKPNIAIIGAGISALSAAHVLTPHCNVTLFDKSRGVGGRMSTRYAGGYEFDHGAQYFTVKDADFQAVIDKAIAAKAAAPWMIRAFYVKSNGRVKDTGGSRYVGAPRMNSLPKYLAQNLNIRLGQRVSKMTQIKNKWSLEFEATSNQDKPVETGFDAIICTAPPAQAQDLLPASFHGMAAITSAKMQACFALMIGLPTPPAFDWDSLRLETSPIAWMAVNSAKPSRNAAATSLVIHADAAWSEAHQDAERDWVQTTLLTAAGELCGIDLTQAPHKALHRWLYASVEHSPEKPCLFDAKLNIAACGDWCLGGRVEGAWLSGQAAGLRLIEAFKIAV